MDSTFVRKTSSHGWAENCFDKARQMVTTSIQKSFSLLVFNFHHYLLLDNLKPLERTVNFIDKQQPENKETVSSPLSQYISFLKWVAQQDTHIASMEEWNDFFRARLKVRMTDVEWNSDKGKLSYVVTNESNGDGLSHVVPLNFENRRVSKIVTNGKDVAHKAFIYQGRECCRFNFMSENENQIQITYS